MVSIEEIRAAIKAAGVEVDVDSLPINVEFKDLGLDSLDRFNIFIELEKVAGKEISDEDIERLQTIDAIQKYLNAGK